MLLDAGKIAIYLYKILIPVIIIVKILAHIGAITLIGKMLEPLMALAGLPGETGLIWAAAIFTNIYGAIATLLTIYPDGGLTVQEITVLCSMMLICHALPVELTLCQKVGGSYKLLGPLRFFGAFLYGVIIFHIYDFIGSFDQPATVTWVTQLKEETLYDWAINQFYNLLFIPCVLFGLLFMMRILDLIGVTKLLTRILSPLLVIIGISAKASTIAIFGLLAGITFGSGLLLAEAKKNNLPKREIFLVLALLSLCHGVIEDTILMLLLGADMYGILWGRIIFALLAMTLISKFYNFLSSKKSRLE